MFWRKGLILILVGIFTAKIVYADNQAIVNANNQAFINYLYVHQNTTYSQNPNQIDFYNLNGHSMGANFGLTKTFSQIYTAINLRAISGELSYSNRALIFSRPTVYSQELNGRLGYSFFVKNSLAFTPYFTLGYQHAQLDAGGEPHNGFSIYGFTQIFQSVNYGVGPCCANK